MVVFSPFVPKKYLPSQFFFVFFRFFRICPAPAKSLRNCFEQMFVTLRIIFIFNSYIFRLCNECN